MSKDTQALDTAIFLRRTLTLWSIRRAGRVPVITKPAYPHCSSVARNLEEASKGSLKNKISSAFGNKAYYRIKASTFIGRSYRVSQKVESTHK